MKVQQHINIPEGEWRPCRSVTLRHDSLLCALDFKRSYSLAAAYEDDLHIRFANAKTDKALMDFIRAWGPIYIPHESVPSNGVISLSLSYCRFLQQAMKALIEVLTAFKWGIGEREGLAKLLETQDALDRDGDQTSRQLAEAFGISGNVTDWVNRTSLVEIRAALEFVVGRALPVSCYLKLPLHQRGIPRRIETGWELLSMEDALLWMIWYDEFSSHAVVCCQECRTIFRGGTARARKYCDNPACAHRATAREWQRRKREQERKANGAQKTR